MKVIPYVNFNGICAEALEFYKNTFNVECTMIQRYSDLPPGGGFEVKEGTENYILHARLDFGGYEIYFSDVMDNSNIVSSLTIAIVFDNAEDVKPVYDKLKSGGSVIMEYGSTFFSKAHGIVKDRFGITWELGC